MKGFHFHIICAAFLAPALVSLPSLADEPASQKPIYVMPRFHIEWGESGTASFELKLTSVPRNEGETVRTERYLLIPKSDHVMDDDFAKLLTAVLTEEAPEFQKKAEDCMKKQTRQEFLERAALVAGGCFLARKYEDKIIRATGGWGVASNAIGNFAKGVAVTAAADILHLPKPLRTAAYWYLQSENFMGLLPGDLGKKIGSKIYPSIISGGSSGAYSPDPFDLSPTGGVADVIFQEAGHRWVKSLLEREPVEAAKRVCTKKMTEEVKDTEAYKKLVENFAKDRQKSLVSVSGKSPLSSKEFDRAIESDLWSNLDDIENYGLPPGRHIISNEDALALRHLKGQLDKYDVYQIQN